MSKEARDYWDNNLEHNPLRATPTDTDAAAHLAYMIEAAGDILRELGKADTAKDYVLEKVNRIKRHIGDRDWADPLSEPEEARLADTKRLLAGMPLRDMADVRLQSLLRNIMARDSCHTALSLIEVEKAAGLLGK